MIRKNRLCIFCKCWFLNSGCDDYSEVTPGEEFETGCNRGKWRVSGYEVNQDQLRKHFEAAKNCDEFDQIKGC